MCGIVGYVGSREAFPVVIKGLQRLEYRGYDSAGVMLYDGSEVRVSKTKGKVFDLKTKAEGEQNTKGEKSRSSASSTSCGFDRKASPASVSLSVP